MTDKQAKIWAKLLLRVFSAFWLMIEGEISIGEAEKQAFKVIKEYKKDL